MTKNSKEIMQNTPELITHAIQQAELLEQSKRHSAKEESTVQIIKSWLKPIPFELRAQVVLEKVKISRKQPYAAQLNLAGMALKAEGYNLFHRNVASLESIQSVKDLNVAYFSKRTQTGRILIYAWIGLWLVMSLVLEFAMQTDNTVHEMVRRYLQAFTAVFSLAGTLGLFQLTLRDDQSFFRYFAPAWQEPSAELQTLFSNTAGQSGDQP